MRRKETQQGKKLLVAPPWSRVALSLFSRVDSDISAANRGKEKLISNLIFDCRLALPRTTKFSLDLDVAISDVAHQDKVGVALSPCFILSNQRFARMAIPYLQLSGNLSLAIAI